MTISSRLSIRSPKRNRIEPKVPESKSGPKPDAKDDLKSLPLPEVEKKLGSSPDGLTQAEAQKRLTQYGPNEIAEKKTNLFLKFLTYFWGPIPWMIEGAVILSGVVRHWLDFFIILLLLVSNAVVGILGRTSGGQRNCRVEGQAGDQGPGEARWEVGHPGWRVSWCRATSSACAWVTLCRRMRACWRAIRWRWISPR